MSPHHTDAEARRYISACLALGYDAFRIARGVTEEFGRSCYVTRDEIVLVGRDGSYANPPA